MQKKLMATYILVISITIIIAVLFCWQMGNKYFKDTTAKYTETKGELLTDILAYEADNNRLNFSSFVDKYSSKSELRLTIIGMDGTVLADSDEDYIVMDNHAYRKEVSSAIKGEIATNIRYSKTIGAYFLYTAIPIDVRNFEGVLRLSVPLFEIRDITKNMIIYVIYGILVGAVISILIAYFVTRKFIDPLRQLTDAAIEISKGNYDDRIYISNNYETGKLAKAFNDMSVKLSLNMWNLEKRNREFESVLSSMINGIIAVDEQYNIFLYNNKLGRILDIDTDIEGKSIYEVIRNTTIFEVLEKSIEQKEYIVDETVINDKIIKVHANPIYAHRKSRIRTKGTLLIIRDITDIKKLETIRTDFVSNVTHELNTPLTSIRGFVDTLKNGAIKDEKVALRFLDIIDIETERLTLLIQDILSLSAIENMEDEKNSNANNMESIIYEVIEILSPKIHNKDIDINIRVDDNITYNCNRNRIKQLLINLTDNAIKYTVEGHIDIICRETVTHIIIEVSDTGIGIDKEHIPRLFERFYRVDKGRSRSMGGTGLGLSIVKHIVSLYNGEIEVESTIGKGSIFRVLLKKNNG